MATLDTRDELTAQFAEELKALGAIFAEAANPQEVKTVLLDALKERSVTEVIAWNSSFLEELGLSAAAREADITWLAATPDVDPAQFREVAARAGAGVTGVDWAVAETGTIALLSGPGRPRMASLLPPLHVAVVRREQLLANQSDLVRGTARLAAEDRLPSAMNLITGPSRTADIEHTLVRKVHGPGELLVILL